MLKQNSRDFVFARCFLTMSWNLMSRSAITVSICYSHLEWSGDALCVYFALWRMTKWVRDHVTHVTYMRTPNNLKFAQSWLWGCFGCVLLFHMIITSYLKVQISMTVFENCYAECSIW
jgi:hypothetical protein